MRFILAYMVAMAVFLAAVPAHAAGAPKSDANFGSFSTIATESPSCAAFTAAT